VLRYSSIQSAEGMAGAEFFWLCWLPGYTRALARYLLIGTATAR
jgi:hypothetical protein